MDAIDWSKCTDCGAAAPPKPDTRGMPFHAAVAAIAATQLPQWYLSFGVSPVAIPVCRPCYAKRHAARQAADVENLRALLARPDISHVSYRREGLCVYRVEPTSPTQCEYIGGCDDTPAARAVLAEFGRGAQQGGQMGHAACVAGMRGR